MLNNIRSLNGNERLRDRQDRNKESNILLGFIVSQTGPSNDFESFASPIDVLDYAAVGISISDSRLIAPWPIRWG